MRKLNNFTLPRFIGMSLLMTFLFLLISPYSAYSNYKEQDKDKNKTKNQQVQKITDDPVTTLLNINNMTYYVQASGFVPNGFYGGSWSSAFPKGTAGGIYTDGIVWGGLVNDGQTPTLRVGGNTYFSGTQSLIDPPRVFRVRPDYLTADLTDDAANFFYFQNYPLDASAVSSGDIQTIRDQYAKDWMEWPAGIGAPFEERNGTPGYQPATDADGNGTLDSLEGDIPGIPGASQSMWIYFNDATAPQAYGSPPIGLEIQETSWAYAVSNPLANVIFKKVSVVYTGLENTPPSATIDDMYLVQWSDPDIGQYTDDFAGCDTALNLGYSYSSSTQDAVYAGLGLAPVAMGYDFLQGVAQFTGNPNDSAIINLKYRKGYKYVHEKPMTTFTYFAAGGAWSDPDGQDPLGTPQWYNLMRGFQPRPEYPSNPPFPANVGGTTAGGVGTYLLSGDPASGSGFVDGVVEGPGDRRIVNITGPFDIALGDTAEIVVALIGGLGSTNTSSIAVLKFNDIFAQYAYDQLFDLPIFPTPTVSSTFLDKKVVLNWDNNATSIENASPKGFDFQGYNVYQFPNSSFNLSDAVRVATFDKRDNVTTILDDQFDESSGLVLELPSQFGTDAGLQRFIEITTDRIRNQPLRNGQEYYFGVSAYGYNPAAEDPESNLPFKALESNIVRITAVPQTPTPGVSYGQSSGAEIEAPRATGTGDGNVNVTVVDPGKTTGNQYEVFFTERQEIRNQNGDWVPASTIIRKSGNPDGPDTLTGTTIDISAVYGPASGQVQLNFSLNLVSSNAAWADGITLTFPSNIIIIEAPNFEAGGGVIAPEVNGNVIDMGLVNHEYTQNGIFHGGEEWSVLVDADLPVSVDWIVYDDGYLNGPVDATGTTVADSIGSLSRLAKYWNLMDVTAGVVKLQNRSDYIGVDRYPARDDIPTDLGINSSPIVDGFQISVDVGYVAPITFFSVQLVEDPTGQTTLSSNSNTMRLDIQNYTIFSGTISSKAIDNFGVGTNELLDLQQDYELRFTGEFTETSPGIFEVTSGGQMATVFRMVSAGALADHPMNPSPGTPAPFLIRIPFEVWNVDDPNNPYQVNMTFRDRERNGTERPFYAWNLTNRMYAIIVNSPYDENQVIQVDGGPDPFNDPATWVLVFYGTNYGLGARVTVTYANPTLSGIDTYTFGTSQATSYSTAKALRDVEKINVFPNPYYGFHYRETTREGKYVSFSHLPARATIRIFDLAGVLVRTIEKDSPEQFTRWNLQNNSNYPVASGIYVVYIDMPDLGTTKILKLAVIQEEQILRVY